MSIAAHLIHTCTIQRATTTIDGYHNAQTTWSDYLLDMPCRLIEKLERVINSITAEQTVVTTLMLLVDSGADITERDRVSSVVMDGETVGPFQIQAVLKWHSQALHHKSLVLESIK